jgi:hypothetical protein
VAARESILAMLDMKKQRRLSRWLQRLVRRDGDASRPGSHVMCENPMYGEKIFVIAVI